MVPIYVNFRNYKILIFLISFLLISGNNTIASGKKKRKRKKQTSGVKIIEADTPKWYSLHDPFPDLQQSKEEEDVFIAKKNLQALLFLTNNHRQPNAKSVDSLYALGYRADPDTVDSLYTEYFKIKALKDDSLRHQQPKSESKFKG